MRGGGSMQPMNRAPRWIFSVLGATLVLLGGAHGAAAAVCADHPNQRAAQIAKDTKDADGDGIFCEALPCPCARPGGSTPSPKAPPKKAAPKKVAPKKPAAKKKAKKLPSVYRSAVVLEALDGDTLRVELHSGRRMTVRLLGIDAPGILGPRNGAAECGGQQAVTALVALAGDDEVTLRTDPTQERVDRHGSLLAYVEPDECSRMTLQQQLVGQGWATVEPAGPKRPKRFGQLAQARDAARAAGAGVWGTCAGDFHQPLLLPPSAAPPNDPAGDRTIVETAEGIHRIGSWTPSGDGLKFRDLVRVWGDPTSYQQCEAEWDDIGASARTSGYAYKGGCRSSSRVGTVKSVDVWGEAWRTNRGLTIGDTAERLEQLYPNPPMESWKYDGDTFQPLGGYFMGGPNGPLKIDLAATLDPTEEVNMLAATFIFGA